MKLCFEWRFYSWFNVIAAKHARSSKAIAIHTPCAAATPVSLVQSRQVFHRLLFLAGARGHRKLATDALGESQPHAEEHTRKKETVGRALDVCWILGRQEQVLVIRDVVLLVHEA